MRNKIQIYGKIKVHIFLCFRIYLSKTFHLCISFNSYAFLNKIGWGKYRLSSKEYPVGFLTNKTCSWFWDELNRRVRRTGAFPTTLNQLRAKNSLRQNYVQRYVTSMRHHCLAVVNSVVEHTCY